MGQRQPPNYKAPDEILEDVLLGYEQAKLPGWAQAQKYLENYLTRNNSLPNGVKFFIYDLLAESSLANKDNAVCLEAAVKASQYLPEAEEQFNREFLKYRSKIKFIEKGISAAVEQGELEQAIKYCDQALALGLGAFYSAKKNSIQRMM